MGANKILMGFHAVAARLRHAPDSVKEVFVDKTRRDRRMLDLIQTAEAKGVRVMLADVARLDGFSKGERHQGVVALAAEVSLARTLDEVLDGAEGTPLFLVLDGVTDPHNLGACLRVADGAGVHAVIAPKDRSAGINATTAKVASGAADSVPYVTVTNLATALRQLKEQNVWVVGTDEQAEKTVFDLDMRGPMALVLGAEGEGMRRLTRETCDELVRIPMAGAVESLNVSVSAGVCLFEAVRQRATVKR
jgi:23S rRNA (guanosine2251-2'-O)-methyltransferase